MIHVLLLTIKCFRVVAYRTVHRVKNREVKGEREKKGEKGGKKEKEGGKKREKRRRRESAQ